MIKEFLFQTYLIALPVILGYITWILKEQKKDRSANAEGTKMLLMVQLIEYHEKYTAQSEIPSYVYDNFQKMYDAYVRMGDGNTSVHQMKKEIDELNLRSQTKKGEKWDET